MSAVDYITSYNIYNMGGIDYITSNIIYYLTDYRESRS